MQCMTRSILNKKRCENQITSPFSKICTDCETSVMNAMLIIYFSLGFSLGMMIEFLIIKFSLI